MNNILEYVVGHQIRFHSSSDIKTKVSLDPICKSGDPTWGHDP